MKNKTLNELLWLIGVALLTILTAILIFDSLRMNGTIDIHLYDTYLVLVPRQILFPVFFVLTTIIFFIKEWRHSFSRNLPNMILVISGLASIIAMTLLTKMFAKVFSEVLGAQQVQPPVANLLSTLFLTLQIIAAIITVYACFCWGKKKSRCNYGRSQ